MRAVSELAEETGLHHCGEALHKLAAIFMAPGFTGEIIHICKAENLIIGQQKTDKDEFIKIHLYPPAEIAEMIDSGKLNNSKTIVGLSLAECTRRSDGLSVRSTVGAEPA